MIKITVSHRYTSIDNNILPINKPLVFIYQNMEIKLKAFKKLIITSVLMSISSVVLAAQITTPKTVKRIFTEGSTSAGFYAVEGMTECRWGIMYLNLSTEAGKGMLSQVLTAKSDGFKVVRIDYSTSASGTCLASGLHIE